MINVHFSDSYTTFNNFQDVASFLQEMETTDVLLDAVLKSQNVRVTVSI